MTASVPPVRYAVSIMPILGGFILGAVLIAVLIFVVGMSAMAITFWPITLALLWQGAKGRPSMA